MLNINIGHENLDGKLKALSINIELNEEGKYKHEYVCINIKNYIRYKVTLYTEDIDLNLDKKYDCYYNVLSRPSIDLVGEFKAMELYPNDDKLFTIEKLKN